MLLFRSNTVPTKHYNLAQYHHTRRVRMGCCRPGYRFDSRSIGNEEEQEPWTISCFEMGILGISENSVEGAIKIENRC